MPTGFGLAAGLGAGGSAGTGMANLGAAVGATREGAEAGSAAGDGCCGAGKRFDCFFAYSRLVGARRGGEGKERDKPQVQSLSTR